MSPSSKKTEVVEPPRSRRQFSPAEKLRIVRDADACRERGEVGALLRREGIYSSHLAAWRKQLDAHGVEGLAARRPGRKPVRDAKDAQIAALEKKAARLERDLELANKLIDLQKKVSEVLGVALPSSEDS
jgi:transposase-like protein